MDMKYAALILIILASVRAHAVEFGNFVHVSGRAEIEVLSDQAYLICGVTKVHKRIDTAVARSARISEAILRIAGAYGIDKSDISTEITELQKEYHNNKDTSTYVGIKSQTIFGIKLRKIDSVSRFVNEMYAAGMNDFRHIEFSYSKQDSLMRMAGDLAMSDALGNAKAMVKHQGREIGKLLAASYEKPDDFDVSVDTRLDDLLGGLYGGDSRVPGKAMLIEYLKFIPKKIKVESKVFAKYELK